MHAFAQWLFVKISAVILADKPADLIVLHERRYGRNPARCLEWTARLCADWQLSQHVLYRCASHVNLLVYHEARMSGELKRVPRWAVDHLGHRFPLDPAGFLAELGRQWQSTGEIPHEVGFCLGYPLKDVLGFTGLVGLRCSGSCGWRIYGRPEASLRRACAFGEARKQALALVQRDRGLPAGTPAGKDSPAIRFDADAGMTRSGGVPPAPGCRIRPSGEGGRMVWKS